MWFDEDAIEVRNAPASGRPGGQYRYSDLAIVTALTLRALFQLPLRQTEGFVASLVRLMGLDLATPDHTTLSRRGRTVEVPELVRQHAGPIHLAIDSTGRGVPAVEVVIPPRKKASRSKATGGVLVQRDAAIERIAEVGRWRWRKVSGANQQARAENAMFRHKRIIGDRLRARRLEAQKREAMIGVLAINRMTELGMPMSVAVAS